MSLPYPPSYFVCEPDQFRNRVQEMADYEADQELIKLRAIQSAKKAEQLRVSQLTPEKRQQELDINFKTQLQQGFYSGISWAMSSGKYNHCHIWLGEDNTNNELRIAREFAKELTTTHGYQQAYVARDFEYDCMRNCIYIVDDRLSISRHNKRKVTSPEPVTKESCSSEDDVGRDTKVTRKKARKI